MDKLARRLREDADSIHVTVSDELDRRIAASLQGVEPVLDKPAAARPAFSPSFWWASTISGVVAAAAIVAVINWRTPPPPEPVATVDLVAAMPDVDWKVESAMLTNPLQKELDDLQADLRKAEEKVKQDIGF